MGHKHLNKYGYTCDCLLRPQLNSLHQQISCLPFLMDVQQCLYQVQSQGTKPGFQTAELLKFLTSVGNKTAIGCPEQLGSYTNVFLSDY